MKPALSLTPRPDLAWRMWLLCAAAFPIGAHGALNDTGMTLCGAPLTGNSPDCSAPGPAGQDRRYGRDAAATAGLLAKIGGGEAGFDFTALDAGGNETAPYTNNTLHACVRDNVTGLFWEVKTDDGGLRDQDWTYTWYDSAHNHGGNPGTASGGNCMSTGRCDTEKYVADINATGLCGFADWRMPTVKELESIVHLGTTNPAIDPMYFPNTKPEFYWSGSPDARDSGDAWYVDARFGAAFPGARRSAANFVRLVRGGQ